MMDKVALSNCENEQYSGGIYKKGTYIFLMPYDHKIYIYDDCLKKISCMQLDSGYTSITYSKDYDMFYTSKIGDNEHLFMLNEEYHEIDKLVLKIPKKYKQEIQAISFNSFQHRIQIALKNIVYSVSEDGYFIKEELSCSSLEQISNKYIMIKKEHEDDCHEVTTTLFQPCITSVGVVCDKVFIAYHKEESAYVSELTENGNLVNTEYIGDSIKIEAILSVNRRMQLLVVKHEKYNYIYVNNSNSGRSCNICESMYEDYCSTCEEMCPRDCDFFRCCDGDVIESIALIETALSHILNAEGEKIQKAVQISKDVCELMKVNESVSKTITNITLLEQILLNKLEMILKINEDTKEPDV